jgi:hypothetical protein
MSGVVACASAGRNAVSRVEGRNAVPWFTWPSAYSCRPLADCSRSDFAPAREPSLTAEGRAVPSRPSMLPRRRRSRSFRRR